MKNLLLILLQLPLFVCYGQKTEISVQANSGLSFYRGKSATSTPTAYTTDVGPPFFYVSSPYSKKSNFPYGLALQVQRVSSKNLLYGIKLGYDRFSTVSHLDRYGGAWGGMVMVENGRVNLQNDLLQANPYFGYRLFKQNVRLDITAGVNVGSILKSTYTVNFDDKPNFFDRDIADNEHINTEIDLGPTLGLAAEYQKVGVFVSYSHGVVNYMKNLNYYPDARVYSRYVRLGVSYRLW